MKPPPLALLVACALWLAASSEPVPALAQDPGAVQRRIAAAQADALAPDDPMLRALVRFYEGRGHAPVWTDGGGLSARGERVVAAIRAAHSDGLDPAWYGLAAIEALAGGRDGRASAELDWLLSRALVELASDLSVGRVDAARLDKDMQVEQRRADPAALLADGAAAADPAAWIASLAPTGRSYAALRAALAVERAKAATAAFTPVPEGLALKPGMRDPRTPALRERLGQIEGLAPPAAGEDPTLYDQALADTVKVYQRRRELSADGVVGALTLASLNVSPADRVEQIVVNMERRRWAPETPGPRYVRVNIADYDLVFVDGGAAVFETDVIVGTPKDQTPELVSTMRGFQINPYWTVPPSIAGEEYLPLLRRDPYALQKNGMRIFASWSDDGSELDPAAVDWSQVSPKAFPYRIRQEPGAGNALGYIFFPFANRYGVYLHDTSSRWLFGEGSRNFSHGCIRVRDPLDFVDKAMRGRGGVTRDRLTEAIRSGAQTGYAFPEPIPLHIVYFTVPVRADGSVEFRDDVYGRDRKVAAAMRRTRPWERAR